ncbi:MAG: DUF6166 domain-containing protein [Gemmataceae bacterium]
MRVYRGRRTAAGTVVTVEDESGQRPLAPRHDLRRHSPAGFEWGYAGSGPAQLALALTADALGDDDRARRVYQAFKFKVVGPLAADTWTLTDGQVRAAVADVERVMAKVADPAPGGRSGEGRSV